MYEIGYHSSEVESPHVAVRDVEGHREEVFDLRLYGQQESSADWEREAFADSRAALAAIVYLANQGIRAVAAIDEIERARASTEHNQLATYVGNVTYDKLTDAERGRPLEPMDAHACIGYDAASALPVERLRELFKADDYGHAWELFDSEQSEWYEKDEGVQEAYSHTLGILRGEEAA